MTVALDLRDCSFFGHALPEPFVKFQLEDRLKKRRLLPAASGRDGRTLQERWDVYRRKLRGLGSQGREIRVANHVLEPLRGRLGYSSLERQGEVATREGPEDGGWLFEASDAEARLRAWTVSVGTDLDAPNRRGRAYRFSPSRVAQRVLQAKGERIGLMTDGQELRVLLCDPARPESHITIRLDHSGGWRAMRQVPDSFRLLLALASPRGLEEIVSLTEEARLSQTEVTKKLREQARSAVVEFVQGVLDHPANADVIASWTEGDAVARRLWRESLVLVYRLLFVFKLESSADPARAFSFAATSLWRNTYSPNTALAPLVRRVIDEGVDTGGFLEEGLRTLFRMFSEGLSSRELEVSPLGGMLFGEEATPLLEDLRWGEVAVARLLDNLLWTPGDGRNERERVHYGALDVEELGRVYEALLELEPGIASEPMCRLRRSKLEVVVPSAQGAQYRAEPTADEDGQRAKRSGARRKSGGKAGGKKAVEWIEEIPSGRFFLRVGLGRKSSGSYYTPHAFVRFLVQETLGPQIAERSPPEDPNPGEILKLKVLDPAMGSGHFLVEACRYLGAALYEACRLCDERALEAEAKAEKAKKDDDRERFIEKAQMLRGRVEELPDPNDELVAYLPSRVAEGEATGLSQRKAEALCRRLVAVHCLYGVDKNELAVGLARVSLWLESYAEGLPLTFLDHRLVCGDSLTGPFLEHLLTFPGSGEPIEAMYARGLGERLRGALAEALTHVRDLERSVGKDVSDLEQKRAAKSRLDEALAPLRMLAHAWAGGVMLGDEASGEDYLALARAVAEGGDLGSVVSSWSRLPRMLEVGAESVPYDLVFPEVFHPKGAAERVGGFDAVLGNPPWDRMLPADKEFFAAFDLRIFDAPTKRERDIVEARLREDVEVSAAHESYVENYRRAERAVAALYRAQVVKVKGKTTIGKQDLYRLFMERCAGVVGPSGHVGILVPSAFHANEGATGVRRLFLDRLSLRCCYSFENRKRLFDIHRSFKFAAVVASRAGSSTDTFECGFYLHDADWLFGERPSLRYSLDFVRRTGGSYLTLLELRTPQDAEVAARCFESGQSFGDACRALDIQLGRELNMTDDSHRFTPIADVLPDGEDPRDPDVAERLLAGGYLTLHEGKTFHQFDDRWGDRPRYLVHVDQLADKSAWKQAARYYRLALRDIASSTNERTVIFSMCPSGQVFGNTAPCERIPGGRSTARALLVEGVTNSYVFDWTLRQKSAAHVNLFILGGCPVPALPEGARRFLVRQSLRLSCNHVGYAALWTDQLGDRWREPKPEHTWPVLEGDDARWVVRAAIDAVVADAYGLDRLQYDHVLSSFNHRSYPKAPERCLAAYDELKTLGLEAFTRKHDPYWDVPLNEELPTPVIDLPGSEGAAEPPEKAGEFYRGKGGQLEIFEPDLGPLFESRSSRPAARTASEPSASPVAARTSGASEEGGPNDDVYEQVVALLRERGTIVSKDVQTLTGLSAAQVRPHLQRLVEQGLAVKEGERRGTRYRKAGERTFDSGDTQGSS